MARIVLGLGTGHASTLGSPPAQGRKVAERDVHDPRMDYAALLRDVRPDMAAEITDEKMHERHQACLRGVARLDEMLREAKPDVLVMVGDDQHEQFLDDNMPMFAIYHGAEMSMIKRRDADAKDPRTSIPGEPALASHLLSSLCDAGLDLARCDRLRANVGLGHAFVNPYLRYLPDRTIPLVPLMVNTYFPPNQPTPPRCYALGKALRRGIETWDTDARVVVIASGGLSHSVIDEELDWMALNAMKAKDKETLCALPVDRLIRGTSEIRNWIIVAGAMEPMDMTIVDYVPYYRSPAGTGCAGGFTYWV